MDLAIGDLDDEWRRRDDREIGERLLERGRARAAIDENRGRQAVGHCVAHDGMRPHGPHRRVVISDHELVDELLRGGLRHGADRDPSDHGIDRDLVRRERRCETDLPRAQVRTAHDPGSGEPEWNMDLDRHPRDRDRLRRVELGHRHECGRVLDPERIRADRSEPRTRDRTGLRVEQRQPDRTAIRVVRLAPEQAHGARERMDVEPCGERTARARDRRRRRRELGLHVDRVACESPQEHGEVRQVVVHVVRPHRRDIREPRERVVGCAELREHRRIANGREPAADDGVATAVGPRALMIQRLRPHEVLAQLDRMRAPAGEVVREPLDGAQRALRATQEDRVGDIRAERPRIAGEMARAEEVAQVGDDPRRARVDEQVVVERVDRLLDLVERGLDGRQVRLQRTIELGVLDLVDRRQPVEQPYALHDAPATARTIR